MLILSPKAIERINSYDPAWPLPKLFRIKKKGTIDSTIFEGSTINTPSMLATEDYIFALEWVKSIGGRQAMFARANANAQAVFDFIEAKDYLRNMVADPALRTNTGVCMVFQGDWYDSLSVEEQANVPKKIASTLEKMDVGYDFNGYRDAPPSLRIWCGGSVELEDIQRLLPWIDWAYHELKAGRL
jgi:phosphoserine aminotransferase